MKTFIAASILFLASPSFACGFFDPKEACEAFEKYDLNIDKVLDQEEQSKLYEDFGIEEKILAEIDPPVMRKAVAKSYFDFVCFYKEMPKLVSPKFMTWHPLPKSKKSSALNLNEFLKVNQLLKIVPRD